MSVVRFLIKIVLALVLLLCLLIAGLILWFNSFLSKPESQEAIRGIASKAAGFPLEFARMEMNIVKGATAEGVKALNPDAKQETTLLASPRVVFSYNLLALLQKKVEITEISLASPRVSLELDPANKIILPVHEEEIKTATSQTIKSNAPRWTDQLTYEVRTFSISDGALSIKGSDGSDRFRMEGLNNTAKIVDSGSDLTVNGQAKIDSLTVGNLVINELHSPYSIEQGSLKLPTINGKAYRGNLTGAFEEKIVDPELPYTFKLLGSQLDLNEMLKQFAGKPDYISGQFSANTNWRGAMTNPKGISGKGDFEISNGQLIALQFFSQLAQILNVKELAQPDFTKARCEYTVENEIVTISSFLLNSALFDFSATGTIGFDSTLKLACEMTLKPDLVKLMPPEVSGRLTAKEDGSRTVAFNVTGTVDKPESDLWLRLALGPSGGNVPTEIKQGVDALKNLFR